MVLAARDCIQYLPMADKILCAITSVGVALAEEAAEKCLVASSAATSVPAVACKGKEGKGGADYPRRSERCFHFEIERALLGSLQHRHKISSTKPPML